MTRTWIPFALAALFALPAQAQKAIAIAVNGPHPTL